jgi:hypothetical protein
MWKNKWSRVKFNSIVVFILINFLLASFSTNNTTSNNEINDLQENINTSDYQQNSRARSTIIDLNLETNKLHQNVTIYGTEYNGKLGSAMCSGDINDDGMDDLIFSGDSRYANGPNNTRPQCGEVYVIFGRSVYSPIIDLSAPPDLIFYGADNYDALGNAMATGDVNNDGITDLILSAQYADGIGNIRSNCGDIYVIFGNSSLPSKWDLKQTPPNLTIGGADVIDNLASSITTGDFNGDNIDDIVMGAYLARGLNNQRYNGGEVYVIFGNTTLPSTIDLKSSSDFIVYGANYNERVGGKVAAGDVNFDGYDDLIINSNFGRTVTGSSAGCGEVYVVFGNNSTSLPSYIDLKTTPANITIYGNDIYDLIGYSVASGDVNGDSNDDIVISSRVADGKNNGRFACGEVYVFFGNSTPATLIKTTEANLTIYGKFENDSIGDCLAIGRYNDDNYDDLLIGVTYADGPEEDKRSNCGDVYLINGRQSFQTSIDLAVQKPNMTIYGAEGDDYAGTSMVLCDINADSRGEIIIGARGADGRSNEKPSSGEIYVILSSGETLKKPIIHSIELINSDGTDGKTCYARYGIPYNYNIKIIADNGLNALNTVTMTLGYDNPGSELKYSWEQTTDSFSETKDPNEYGMVSDKSYSKNDGNRIWTIKFFIIFNWTYPDYDLHKVQAHTNYDSGEFDWLNLTSDIYHVENRLKFVGAVTVKGKTQGNLTLNDWVRSYEHLTWGGLQVVYIDDDNKYPPKNGGVTVTILDSSGGSWEGPTRQNKNILINSTAGNSTKLNETYTLCITGVPPPCSMSTVNYSLNIDADPVNFSNPFPDNKSYFAKLNPLCGIRLTDPTTFVSQESVQYRISTDDGQYWSSWMNNSMKFIQDDFGINCTVRPNLKEGINNLIQWRAQDIVKNNYSTSDAFQVLTDVSNVTFQNPTPNPDAWQPELMVDCGITIIDELSGVNASSIEFRVSTTGVWGYGDWQSARKSENDNTIRCSVSPLFIEGTQNYINWRAKDIVGNGYQFSDNYPVKVKLNNPPESELVSPKNEALFNTLTPELFWKGSDKENTTQLNYHIYLSSELFKIQTLNNSALLISNFKNTSYKIPTLPDDQTSYYWTVIPNDEIVNGSCKSGIWEFRVDTTLEIPFVSLITPLNNSEIEETKPTLLWSLNYSNPELITYNLTISKSPDLKEDIIVSSMSKYRLTMFIIEPALIPGETYYWTVIPTANLLYGKFHGKCQSGIWNFKVILPSENIYNISMKLDVQDLKVVQGNYTSTQILIKNSGNVPDMISIHINKGILDATVALEDSDNLIRFESGEQKIFKIGILVSPIATPQNYTIYITTRSNEALDEKLDVSVTESINLEVIEKAKDVEPIPEEPDEPTEKASDMSSIIWLLAIIIVILFLIISLFVYRIKKAKKIPYVDSEILYKPSKHIKLTSAELKGKKEPELPLGEDGVPVFESPVISPQYQLPRARLTKDQRLDLLEERLLLGEVSEETYKELKTKIESSKEEPVKEKETEDKELDEAEVEQEEMVKEDKELEVEDIEKRESEEVQEAISETPEKETEEHELAVKDIDEESDIELEMKESIEPEPKTEVIPVVTETKKPPLKKKMKKPRKKKKKLKIKAKAKNSIEKDEIDEEKYEKELEDSHHTSEEVFWNDGTCVKCAEYLELTSEYCWHCGTKYKVRKKHKKKKE